MADMVNACEPGTATVVIVRAMNALSAAGGFLTANLGSRALVLDCGFSSAFRDACGGVAPYDADCFGHRVLHYSPGHPSQPPSLASLVGACTTALAWLRAHAANVIVVLAPSALHYTVTFSALALALHAASAHAPDRLSAAAITGAVAPTRPSDERILLALSRALLPDAAVPVSALGAEGRAVALAEARARAAADDEYDVAASQRAAAPVALPPAFNDAWVAVVAAIATSGAALTDEMVAGGGSTSALPQPPGTVDTSFCGSGVPHCPVGEGGVLLTPAAASKELTASPIAAKWRNVAAATAARLTGGGNSPSPTGASSSSSSFRDGETAATPTPASTMAMPSSSAPAGLRVFPWLSTAAVRQVRLFRELLASRGALVAWDAPPVPCCHGGDGAAAAAARGVNHSAAAVGPAGEAWAVGGAPSVTCAAGAAGAESLPAEPREATLLRDCGVGCAGTSQQQQQQILPQSSMRRPQSSSRLVSSVTSLLRVASSRGPLRAPSIGGGTSGGGVLSSSASPSSSPPPQVFTAAAAPGSPGLSPLSATNPIASANAAPLSPGGRGVTRSRASSRGMQSPSQLQLQPEESGGQRGSHAGGGSAALTAADGLAAPPPALQSVLPYSYVYNVPHGDLGVRVAIAASTDGLEDSVRVIRTSFGGVGSFIGPFVDGSDEAGPLPQYGRLLRRCVCGGLTAWSPQLTSPSDGRDAGSRTAASAGDGGANSAAASAGPRESHLEVAVRPSPRVVLRYVVLSAAPAVQAAEVFHTEVGACPAVMVLASDPTGAGSVGSPSAHGGGCWRLIFSSLVQGRRRYRSGHGPVIIPLHVAVHGEAVVRLFDLKLNGEGLRLCSFRVHAGLLAPHDDSARRGQWATVTHVGRRELGIASGDTRFTPDFHVSLVASALPDRLSHRPLHVPLIAPLRFRGAGVNDGGDEADIDVAPDLIHVACSTPGCGEYLRLRRGDIDAAKVRVLVRAASRERRLDERLASAAASGLAINMVSHDYDDPVEPPLVAVAAASAINERNGGRGGSAAAAPRTPPRPTRGRRRDESSDDTQQLRQRAEPALARSRPSVACTRCGYLQYVPAIAAVLAGVTTESAANAKVIPPLDARVTTHESRRAALHAHPFDVAADAAAGEGVALRGMVAARKRARAGEESVVATLTRAFPTLGETTVRAEYRAVVVEDAGSVDDLYAQLEALRESAIDGGGGARTAGTASARQRPTLEWAESANTSSSRTETTPPSRGAAPAAASVAAVPTRPSVTLSLAHRVGLASQRAGSDDGEQDGILYASVSDVGMFDPASPIRPGVRLRTPFGCGIVTAVRLLTRDPVTALPPSTPLECEVAGYVLTLPFGSAYVNAESVRISPPEDAEDEELRRAAAARRGTAGARSRAAGTARARRMADQAADADAALARRLQAEAIAEAFAEDGEDDVDVRRLMYDDDGLQLMRNALQHAVPGLRGGRGAEGGDDNDGDDDDYRPPEFQSLQRTPEVLYASISLMRYLHSITTSVAEATATLLPPSGAGMVSATPPAVQDARADAALRVLVADTVFDRASVRAADPDSIAALPLHTFEGSSSDRGTGVQTGSSSGGDADECVVCRDEYTRGDVLRQLPCGHRWHARCVDPWLLTDARCPLCGVSILRGKQPPVRAQ